VNYSRKPARPFASYAAPIGVRTRGYDIALYLRTSAADAAEPDHPYLVIQRQFEDDDDGVCYIETHDHDTYAGHFRLKLIEFTATGLAFEIARTDHKYVEVTYDLDPKQFNEVQRIVHIVFGVQD
jgi:hypothetical protein